MIGGGELKIDPMNMEAIIKWLVPTNVTKFRSFVGEAQYLWKLRKFPRPFSMPLNFL
jgi:hypothetical protein